MAGRRAVISRCPLHLDLADPTAIERKRERGVSLVKFLALIVSTMTTNFLRLKCSLLNQISTCYKYFLFKLKLLLREIGEEDYLWSIILVNCKSSNTLNVKNIEKRQLWR